MHHTRPLAKGQRRVGLNGREAPKTLPSLADATLCLLPPGAKWPDPARDPGPPLPPSSSWVSWWPGHRVPKRVFTTLRFGAAQLTPVPRYSSQVLPAVLTGPFSGLVPAGRDWRGACLGAEPDPNGSSGRLSTTPSPSASQKHRKVGVPAWSPPGTGCSLPILRQPGDSGGGKIRRGRVRACASCCASVCGRVQACAGVCKRVWAGVRPLPGPGNEQQGWGMPRGMLG